MNKYDIITKEPKERIEMITKEDYQLIRSHPAFSEIPVEKFDKLAVEIHYREIPKGQILFFAGDKRDRIFLVVAMSALRSLILQTPSRIWITLKKELSSHTVVCLQIQLITIQPLP